MSYTKLNNEEPEETNDERFIALLKRDKLSNWQVHRPRVHEVSLSFKESLLIYTIRWTRIPDVIRVLEQSSRDSSNLEHKNSVFLKTAYRRLRARFGDDIR